MRMRILLGGLVVVGWSAFLVGQTPETPSRVEDLIEKLGSSTFAEREKAHKALKALDVGALDALKRAAETSDLEVKRRLEEVIRRLEEKKLNQDVLAPKKVRLNVKEVTVNEAVNELAKLSGYPLQLQGDLVIAKEKKITLDTGEVTFWEALDQLCEKSGLVDVTNQQAAAVDPRLKNPIRNPINVRPLPAPIKKLPVVPNKIQPQPAPGVLPVVPPAQVRPLPAQIQPLPAQIQPLPAQIQPAVPAQPLPLLPEPPAPPQPQNQGAETTNDAQVGAPAEQPKAEPAQPQQAPAPPVRRRPAQAQPAQVQVQVQQIQIGGFGGQVIGPNVGGASDNKITLKVDENAKPAPTSYHGATRVRLLPIDKAKETDKAIFFTLDIAPEPRLESFRIDGMPTIEKAIDDQGQSLAASMETDSVSPNTVPGFNPMIMPIGMPMGLPGAGRQVTLRLQKGDKASRVLKELKGTITAEVEIPNEKLLEVANILKATGEKVKTTSGGTVEIKSVKKQGNGDYVVNLVLDGQNGNPFGGGAGVIVGGGGRIVIRGGGGMVINGRNIGPAPDKDAPKLLDAKGNAFQIAAIDKSLVIENNSASQEMTITYRPNPGQQEPSKLVQFGSRPVKVNIPFAFRDVAIP